MDRKNKVLIMRQLRVSLMILKRTFLLLRAASFFTMLFLSSSSTFLLVNFVRDRISSTYPLVFSSYRASFGGRCHVFLICNGILVILILCSSRSRPPPAAEEDRDHDVGETNKGHVFHKGQGYDWQTMLLPHQLSERMQDPSKEERKADGYWYRFIQQHEQLIRIEQEESMHNLSAQYYSKTEQHSGAQSDDQLACIAEEAGATAAAVEDAGDEWCSLSTDELNRKCEDFIRKMKEEMIKSEQGRRLTSSSSATLAR